MQFTLAMIAGFAAVAFAAPQAGGASASATDSASPAATSGMTVAQAQSQCKQNNTLSCCNQAPKGPSNAALGDVLDDLLGVCSLLPINAVGGSAALSDHCKDTPACCPGSPTESNGNLININVACSPLSLF